MSRMRASLLRFARRISSTVAGPGRSERLRVYLGHDALAVCTVRGRLRPALTSKIILPFVATGRSGMHDVAPALAALASWLHAHPHRGGIEWIVGIYHVRYIVLPWDERLSDPSFCCTLAAALFAQQCASGDLPFSAHRLRFAALVFGRPRLVALISDEKIRALTAFSVHHKCRTRRIETALSVVWNRFLVHTKNENGELALIEGPRLMRIAYERGHLLSLSVQPFSGDRSRPLPRNATWVFPIGRAPAPLDGERMPKGLAPEGLVPADDPRLAYALCGVF